MEVEEGMQVDRGFISPQFVTNQARTIGLLLQLWG